MRTFRYNDMEFAVERSDRGWDVTRRLGDAPGGGVAWVGCGLYAGATEDQALERAQGLVRTVYPAGARCVGPDVAHPTLTTAGLRIVGPDVAHANFIHWNQDSASFPR